ncbi:MAG: DUF4440 domain-containing protein [Rhizobium sp.]|nr:MAG: DUF4440 domain-containing protein [Rhizobium sp.]
MEVSQAEFQEIRRLEEELHRPEIRQSSETVASLLAIGFVEFGSSGTVYSDRDHLIMQLAAEKAAAPSPPVVARDYAFRSISPDAVLITYRSIRPPEGDRPARHVLRSSIWQRIDGRWQMIFHQGTPTASDI